MEEEILYRGARIAVYAFGPGWRAEVFMPGTKVSEALVPRSLDPTQRDFVVAEAKGMIDRNFGLYTADAVLLTS